MKYVTHYKPLICIMVLLYPVPRPLTWNAQDVKNSGCLHSKINFFWGGKCSLFGMKTLPS